MNKEVLLYRLRARLEWVERLLADVAHVQPASNRYLYACGQTMELRSEALFLAGLLLNPPIGAGPSTVPAFFSLALDNQPVVRNVDVSPTLGLLIVGAVGWVTFPRAKAVKP